MPDNLNEFQTEQKMKRVSVKVDSFNEYAKTYTLLWHDKGFLKSSIVYHFNTDDAWSFYYVQGPVICGHTNDQKRQRSPPLMAFTFWWRETDPPKRHDLYKKIRLHWEG